MNLSHVWTAIAGIVLIAVGALWPDLQDTVSQLLVAVGALVTAVFGGHAVGQAHASLKGRSTV